MPQPFRCSTSTSFWLYKLKLTFFRSLSWSLFIFIVHRFASFRAGTVHLNLYFNQHLTTRNYSFLYLMYIQAQTQTNCNSFSILNYVIYGLFPPLSADVITADELKGSKCLLARSLLLRISTLFLVNSAFLSQLVVPYRARIHLRKNQLSPTFFSQHLFQMICGLIP